MTLYRAEMRLVYQMGVRVDLHKYTVIKETDKGYWIAMGCPSVTWLGQVRDSVEKKQQTLSSFARWMSKTAKNRYARETKEEALNDFIIRQRFKRRCLEERLENCNIAIALAASMEDKEIMGR